MPQNQKLTATDMREFHRDRDRKVLYLVIFTLVVIGGFLIALFFGLESFLIALPCLAGGVALILIPWFVLAAIARWRNELESSARNEAGVGKGIENKKK